MASLGLDSQKSKISKLRYDETLKAITFDFKVDKDDETVSIPVSATPTGAQENSFSVIFNDF